MRYGRVDPSFSATPITSAPRSAPSARAHAFSALSKGGVHIHQWTLVNPGPEMLGVPKLSPQVTRSFTKYEPSGP